MKRRVPLANVISFPDAAKAAAERARLEEEAQKHLECLRLHCRRVLAAGTASTLELARLLRDVSHSLTWSEMSLKNALSPADKFELDVDRYWSQLRCTDNPRPGMEACAKLMREGVFEDAANGKAAAKKAIAGERSLDGGKAQQWRSGKR